MANCDIKIQDVEISIRALGRTQIVKKHQRSKIAAKMICGMLSTTTSLCSISIFDPQRPTRSMSHSRAFVRKIRCSSLSPDMPITTEKSENGSLVTGAAYDFERSTTSLSQKLLSTPKNVMLVRHGLSSWNDEGRVQGSSNLSVLTETGVRQAEKCREALANIYFDQCFSSPISRAKSTAEVIWQGREEPLVFLDSLKEAHLFFLEGMRNVDARQKYPKEFTKWREDPANFDVNGFYPIRKLWVTAREAWREILLTPGKNVLVVTHKSILRALICTALGLSPERFRAIDVNNGGISMFSFNKKGEAMLQSLNMTAHMYSDHVYQI
ncbi:2-carboxy-D-arabinitol-1-phosphatase [Tripterygium wilfordii]|uniref:2-carboxy-D-arabinitol-1-phosphatase n=1 Tax=Tripterygium wilfordii TaxID=458696 RepID=A0A7J7C461_TRIWF|nr:probable 2-carboxy-D-arabinitol-1-phosphatase isoform X2 [Tripterygium wilfordii]KAF5728913.1 2-carboxy-D-arabinitol-1-phosphatase [Tripterygium wilfordii]